MTHDYMKNSGNSCEKRVRQDDSTRAVEILFLF